MTTPLEGALREMLHERAGDIQDFPARLARLEDRTEVPIDEDLLDSRAARHSGWLLAAAVALIVAIAGAIVGIRQLSSHDTPPATPNSVAPTSTPTRPTSTAMPTTTALSAQLHWEVSVAIPAGYQLRERAWTPRFQTITLRRLGDPDAVGCCGSLPTTDYVTVYPRGAYDATGVKGGQPVEVGSAHGWFAQRRDQDFDGETPLSNKALPTVSWQYAPNAWAVVRATTPETQRLDQLLLVAAAVRTGASSPISTPVRLGYLPPGFRPVRVDQDTNEKYGTTFEFDGTVSGQHAGLTIQVWSIPGPAESLRGASRIVVDGRDGYLPDPAGYGNSAYVRLGGHSAEFAFNDQTDSISDDPSATGAATLREILTRAHWSSNPADPKTWFDARHMLP